MPEIILPSYFQKQQQKIREVADQARGKLEHLEAHAPDIKQEGAGEFLKWLFHNDYLNPYLEVKHRKQRKPNVALLLDRDGTEGVLHEAACVHAMTIDAYRESAGTKVVLGPSYRDRLTALLDGLYFEEDPRNRENNADGPRKWTADALRVDTELGQIDEVHEHTRSGNDKYVTDKREKTNTWVDHYTTAFVEEPRLVFGVPSDSILTLEESERYLMPYKLEWFNQTSRRVRSLVTQEYGLELTPKRGSVRRKFVPVPRLANSF